LTRRIAAIHLWLGLVCALPMFAWTSSGFVASLPRSATAGVTYQAIDFARLHVDAGAATARARGLAGEPFKISSMTLEQRNNRLSWLIIAGPRGVRVDGETGEAAWQERSSFLSSYFAQAHFLWFAGALRMPVMIGGTAAMIALLLSGLVLAFASLRRKISRPKCGLT
jgi:hypothetical protein